METDIYAVLLGWELCHGSCQVSSANRKFLLYLFLYVYVNFVVLCCHLWELTIAVKSLFSPMVNTMWIRKKYTN